MSNMQAILNPASVAVVGASNDPAKLTGRPIAFLQKQGFAGAIYPINPRYEEIAGLKSYAAVADLPEAPDLGLVLVGAHRVIDAVRDLEGVDVGETADKTGQRTISIRGMGSDYTLVLIDGKVSPARM